ncbi:MAG: thioesterase-like protein [Myxococcaceae bacterium]|nr:thioesterase-like protein [Myxococcaceae bacterium]
MTTPYALARQLTKDDRGVRNGLVDPSWHQGRGAFGGLLAAMTLAAMAEDLKRSAIPDGANDAERIPRSLTVHFCAPASGAIALTTEIVRVGSRVAHATARIANEKGVTTIASASFCKDRPRADGGDRYLVATMPVVESAANVPELRLAGVPGIAEFFQHVDARFCGPITPFSSAKEARLAAWVRLREPALLDAPLAALLLDSLPPAVTATFGMPRPVASVDFTIHFFSRFAGAPGALTIANDEHQLVTIRSRWADDGYTEELRELWSPRGELLAQCRQLIALL